MIKNNFENPFFLFVILLSIITINTISSIYFQLIMIAGVLFNAFYICLKKRYLYSLAFVIITFLFVEINSGLKPFTLILLSFFLYIFIIPKIESIISFHTINYYIYIILFNIGVTILLTLSSGFEDKLINTMLSNTIIDMIFFGLFI